MRYPSPIATPPSPAEADLAIAQALAFLAALAIQIDATPLLRLEDFVEKLNEAQSPIDAIWAPGLGFAQVYQELRNVHRKYQAVSTKAAAIQQVELRRQDALRAAQRCAGAFEEMTEKEPSP